MDNIKKSLPTNFPDAIGVNGNKEQNIIILDFLYKNSENSLQVFSSVVLTKEMADNLIKNIKKALEGNSNDN